MPGGGAGSANVADELARIWSEVEGGRSDLSALGFWTLVAKVKRDPALIEAHAEEIGEIDRMAFQRRFRIRPPIWLGNLVLVLGVGLVKLAVWVAYDLAAEFHTWWIGYGPADPQRLDFPTSRTVAGVLLLAAAGALSVAIHDLAHWAFGRIAGIRFSSYFLDGPFRIQPGIKTDYASYLRADPRARARMHAAGAVASKLAPFLVFTTVYVAHRSHDYRLFPSWSLWGLLGIGVLQIVTDVAWSTKRSDWKKYRRERAVAADLYSDG